MDRHRGGLGKLLQVPVLCSTQMKLNLEWSVIGVFCQSTSGCGLTDALCGLSRWTWIGSGVCQNSAQGTNYCPIPAAFLDASIPDFKWLFTQQEEKRCLTLRSIKKIYCIYVLGICIEWISGNRWPEKRGTEKTELMNSEKDPWNSSQ